MTGKVIDTLKRATKDGNPILLVIAGPNGAGKSTFHNLFIYPLGLPFVNADRIAQSQSRTKKLSGDYVGNSFFRRPAGRVMRSSPTSS